VTEPDDSRLPHETSETAHVRRNAADQTVTTQVATAVASALGTTQDDLTPVGTVLDAEALNQLFVGGGDTGVVVGFDYEGCRVTVDADQITVDPPHHTLSPDTLR
jgi:hypothetical protein